MGTLIPWVYGSPCPGKTVDFEYRIKVFNEIFDEHFLQALKIQDAQEAIRNLTTIPYLFIISGIKVPPGKDYQLDGISDMSEDKRQYWKFGLEVIRNVRADSSTNRKTPYYIITDIHPADDEAFPGAESVSLEAGANAFYSLKSGRKGESSLCGILYSIREKTFGR